MHHVGVGDAALERRVGAVGQQPGRDRRQERQVIVGFGRALSRNPRQRAEAGRERVRKQRIALDHPGIAIGCLLPRRAAVQERDREAALDEVQRDRGADDAGTEHDGVSSRHGCPFMTRN
jgi:hypothetical protein